ncbi:hypothetical protein LepocDRAFT_00005300 [Leptothrix ochracea L12]|uniref:Lipoprotein n=1 Tax=Leptothrix ochracea L12 TaxID=735332 RepID=I4Z6E6_9BURK|nr:hypothetical protein [Leptothrix ochracea]EIM31788.1 hypothetical protein LepocDRAFT_00005300 [Leptothrix ochracea L12]
MKKYLVVMLMVSTLSGCGSLMSQKVAELAPTRVTAQTGEMVTLPAQLRTITNKTSKGSYISCAEPGPDVAMSDTFKLIAGITTDTSSSINNGNGSSASAGNKTGLNNDLQTSTAALELAGRTQTVLLAREFLYRTCEAASNGWIKDEAVARAHESILKNITDLIDTDKKKAETTAAIAGAVATGKLDPKLLGNAAIAVSGAIRDACTKDFEECITKAGVDEKAKGVCRANLNKCF